MQLSIAETKKTLKLEYDWCMPDKHTFRMAPFARMLIEEFDPLAVSVDPFSGASSPAAYTNDINPERPTGHHLDAIEFLRLFPAAFADVVILDWPYSNNQYRECYLEANMPVNVAVFNAHYQATIKDEIARITKIGGKCLSFGWTTVGIGLTRGFQKTRILNVEHGRMHNNTLATVEVKVQDGAGAESQTRRAPA